MKGKYEMLYPTVMLRRVSDLTPGLLKKLRVSALILDVDNTLTTHNNPVPAPDVLKWIGEMKKHGIALVIASNNKSARIKPFAKMLGIDWVARALKPLPVGFLRVSRRLGIRPDKIGVVGDQIFTDILGGNLFGAKTVLVQPLELEGGFGFRIKRELEKPILKRYRKKQSRERISL